jgi:hypothetical protein
MTRKDIENQKKHMLEKKIAALNKQKLVFSYLSRALNSTIELKDSLLMENLKTVVKSRRFHKYHAICIGFLDGCFLPFFAGWLLLDGVKAILTCALCPPTIAFTGFTPIGLIATAIIAGITILIGISYGIYSAYKAKQIHEARFENLETKITAIRDELPNKRILTKSMRDYDRLLRRYSDEQPAWTNVKKALNRFLVIVKRLGTGSLVFRLIIWGPISAIVAASTTIVPAFFSIILIAGMVIGALVIAAWYFYAYNLESKFRQAGNVVEHLVQIEQLDSINKELQQKEPTKEFTSPEALNTEIQSSKLILFSKNDNNLCSILGATQKNSIDNEFTVTGSAKIDRQANNNLNQHRLFKNTQDTEENSVQSMETCLSNA